MRRGEKVMEGLKITTLALGVALLATTAHANENNEAMKYCLDSVGYNRNAPIENRFEGIDWAKAAKCYQAYRDNREAVQTAALNDFLKHNPRYRYPGQSNNRCWGKEREMPFTSASIEAGPGYFRAGVSYKDTMPAGCYETGPWDNRLGTHDYDG